ncbi:MAG: cupredoxin domain-containing protein [Actinomycetota bacterium]
MDPEQIYQEVLQEEQAKGSAAPVAEGRAKSARQRAAEGSPHPKEAKWWPGSQPHFEGGGEDTGAEEAPTEEPVEEAPAEEPAAAEAPAEEPAVAEAPAAQEEPAPAAAPPPAAEQPVTQQQPAAAAVAAPPAGVRHGTPTGNRLRPEDGVSTEAQFAGQQAMYDRRKLIDDLVATGVPAISAEDTDSRSPFLAVLYILIPLLAVFIVVNQQEPGAQAGGEAHGEAEPGGEGQGGGESGGADADASVAASNIAFDSDLIEVPAASEVSIFFDNADTAEHDISVFQDQQAALAFVSDGDEAGAIFIGEIIQPGGATTYAFESPEAGEYYFHCDVHPNMNGTFITQ